MQRFSFAILLLLIVIPFIFPLPSESPINWDHVRLSIRNHLGNCKLELIGRKPLCFRFENSVGSTRLECNEILFLDSERIKLDSNKRLFEGIFNEEMQTSIYTVGNKESADAAFEWSCPYKLHPYVSVYTSCGIFCKISIGINNLFRSLGIASDRCYS